MREVKEHKPAFFVEVQDHLSLRRGILQSLRDVLDSLQKFHDFHKKKEERARKVANLRAILGKTSKLIWQVKSSLPEIKLRQEKGKKQKMNAEERQPNQPKEIKAIPKPPRQKSELDMLEEELAAIEKKLNRLA